MYISSSTNDDKFGTGFLLLHYAIKSENPEIATLLICHVHEIDVNHANVKFGDGVYGVLKTCILFNKL